MIQPRLVVIRAAVILSSYPGLSLTEQPHVNDVKGKDAHNVWYDWYAPHYGRYVYGTLLPVTTRLAIMPKFIIPQENVTSGQNIRIAEQI